MPLNFKEVHYDSPFDWKPTFGFNAVIEKADSILSSYSLASLKAFKGFLIILRFWNCTKMYIGSLIPFIVLSTWNLKLEAGDFCPSFYWCGISY